MAGKGGMDKAKGKAKEMTGRVMGDPETQIEGKFDQARGEAKKAGGKTRERIQEAGRSAKRDRT